MGEERPIWQRLEQLAERCTIQACSYWTNSPTRGQRLVWIVTLCRRDDPEQNVHVVEPVLAVALARAATMAAGLGWAPGAAAR